MFAVLNMLASVIGWTVIVTFLLFAIPSFFVSLIAYLVWYQKEKESLVVSHVSYAFRAGFYGLWLWCAEVLAFKFLQILIRRELCRKMAEREIADRFGLAPAEVRSYAKARVFFEHPFADIKSQDYLYH